MTVRHGQIPSVISTSEKSMALQADAILNFDYQSWSGSASEHNARFQVRSFGSRDCASGVFEFRGTLELDTTWFKGCQRELLSPSLFPRVASKRKPRLDQGARSSLNGVGFSGYALLPCSWDACCFNGILIKRQLGIIHLYV